MWLYNSGPALNNDGCINAAKGKVVTLQKHTINLAGFMQLIGKRKLTAVCSHQTRIGNLDAHLI